MKVDGDEYLVYIWLSNCSLKLLFPDLERRQIDIEERNYLKDVGVVTEMQCDLGRYRYNIYSSQGLQWLVSYFNQGMLASELSSHILEMSYYMYASKLLSHILIGFSLLSQKHVS